jgi:excisionase family DNA binding protein
LNTVTTTDRLTLSIPETAAALGVSRPTVYNLVRQEGFPAFRIGGRTVVSRPGLEAWVQEQEGNYAAKK